MPIEFEPFLSDLLASIALLSALLFAQFLVSRGLKRGEDLSDQAARRWAANFRNALVLIAIVGMIMIWAPQLRTFALSLTAVAVAIVIATKELIVCISGSMLRTFTQAYTVGDFVEVGAVRGEVLDCNLLGTRLKEYDASEHSYIPTGREIAFPNSLLFGSTIKVQSTERAKTRHRIVMVFDADFDIFAMDEALKTAVAQTLSQHLEGSAEATASHMLGLAYSTTDLGKYKLEVDIDGGLKDLSSIESEIIRDIGSLAQRARQKALADQSLVKS